jgi:hypothetical protein
VCWATLGHRRCQVGLATCSPMRGESERGQKSEVTAGRALAAPHVARERRRLNKMWNPRL